MTDEQIIEALDIADGSDELKKQVVGNTRDIVELRVIAILSELMTEEQSDEFQALVDTGDNQAVWDWLRTEVAGADVREVYEAALLDYIEEFKARQRSVA